MKNLVFYLFIVLFSATNLNAQKFINDNLVHYFENDGDLIFTHLNKTNFINGELVWFKTYQINRKTDFLKTDATNLYLSVFDEDNNKIDEFVFFTKNGVSIGQFEIDDNYTAGKYSLNFSTNYNNSNELQHLNHQLNIEVIEDITYEKPEKDYTNIDLQILPESGHGLYNHTHKYGVKAINTNGLGVAFEASVLKNGEEVTRFKSNELGMGAFNLNPQPGNDYKIKVIAENQQEFTQDIDAFEENGALISAHLLPDAYLIKIHQNLDPNGFENFDILVHQAGKYFEVDVSQLSNLDSFQFNLPNQQLFTGVNTITLFYNKKPIAERLIFKHQENYINSDDVVIRDQFNPTYDSIQLNIRINQLKNDYTNLSFSALHKNSIANTPKHNIISKVLLSPYLKGEIEKPYSYFTDLNFANQYNLDLLLLTQGWSSYNWDKILSGNKPDEKYRENGIEQELEFLSKSGKSKKFLLVKENIFNEDEVFKLDRTKKIKTNLIFPVKNQDYNFYSFNKKEQHYKAPKFKISTKINFPEVELQEELLDYRRIKQYQQQLEVEQFENVELLDEVLVIAKKKTKIGEEANLGYLRDQKVEIGDDFVQQFPYVADYLRYRGYLVDDTGNNFSIRPMARNSINAGLSPAIFINGTFVENLSILSNARTSDFESIEINKDGFGEGVRGANGTIRFEMRKTMLFQNTDNRFRAVTMKEGYESTKTFYNPEYSSFSSNKFQLIAGIHWEPEIISNDGEFRVSMKNLDFKNYKFFIEGITENGQLISIPLDYQLKSEIFD